MGEEDTIYVLDANVFIHGASRELSRMFPEMVTVPAVTAELESQDAGQRLDVEDVAVMEPSDTAVEQVEDAARDTGEDVSETDMEVVALALEQDATVVSDDYGVQNVAALLDVAFTGFRNDEITEQITWEYECSGCENTFDTDEADEHGSCPVCGGELEKVAGDREPV